MAFGKKKEVDPNVNQGNVALRATQALATMRSTRLKLVTRLILDPTLMNRWTSKAIQQMLGKMANVELPRPPKDLTEEFKTSWYRNMKGEVALPCRLIKAAIVEGAISTQKVVSKAELNRELRVRGFTTPVYAPDGSKLTEEHLEMDIRPVRNASGGPDLRSRAISPQGCYVDILLDFPPTLSPDKVMAAIDGAGATIGLCDWRPARGGEFGTFSVDVDNCSDKPEDIKRVLEDCASPEERFVIPEFLLKAYNALGRENAPDPARKAMSNHENIEEQHRRAEDSSVDADLDSESAEEAPPAPRKRGTNGRGAHA